MPLLPRKNSLDYNPDATILASKKLSAISLENLKNPLEDPDQSTLSTLQAQKKLGDTFNTLEEMAGNYHSLVLRLANLLFSGQPQQLQFEPYIGEGRKKKGGRKQKMRGGAGEYDDDRSDTTGSTISPSEFRRNPQLYANRSSDSSLSGFSDFTDLSDYHRRIEADRQRFRQFYGDDDRNSTATPASSNYPYDDPSEPSIDDEDNSTIPTRRSFAPDGGDVPEALRAGESSGANFNSLIFPLIQLTRRMNILVNSRIKPAISSLSQSQVGRLTDIYKMVRTSYNDVVRPQGRVAPQRLIAEQRDPFTRVPRRVNAILQQQYGDNSLEQSIIEQNQFGDEMLSTWNQERQNLLLNLTIIINSWRQNTPTGQQTSFSEDINRSFENTATRLGARADLVEARQGGLQGTDYEGRLLDRIADTESVATNFGNINQGIPYEPVPDDRSVQQLRQYDAQGNLIGQGRKPRGRPKKTGAMTLIGNGRNFYGDQINTSRDIPTIFSGAMRNCPTKYLL